MYDIIVVENLRFSPSTRKREANVCKNLHLGERFRKKHAFSGPFLAFYARDKVFYPRLGKRQQAYLGEK